VTVREGASVSVIITTYNQAQFIADAVSSALKQTLAPLEVIVVDDGSIDDTPSRLQAFGDRITVIRQRNQGVAASRNTGVAAARGELLAFLDGDDLWQPEKLEVQVGAYRARPEAGLVAVDGVEFDSTNLLRETLFDRRLAASIPAGGSITMPCRRVLIEGNLICTVSQIMIPKAVLEAVGASDGRYATASDYDLYLRIAARFPFTLVGRSLVRWRYVATSASGPRNVRWLRWWMDELRVLKRHLRTAARPEKDLVRRAIVARAQNAARQAYDHGREHDKRVAVMYLFNLLRTRTAWPSAVPFLLGLSVPHTFIRWIRSRHAH
jgi:glycosyltransferase involved in cell wall biosynthesis